MSDEKEHRDPQEIRKDIRQTTAELTETLEALQDKLQPEALAAEAKEIVIDEAGNFRDRILIALRDHPAAAAAIALGGAWLIGRTIVGGPRGGGFISLALGALIGVVVYRAVTDDAPRFAGTAPLFTELETDVSLLGLHQAREALE